MHAISPVDAYNYDMHALEPSQAPPPPLQEGEGSLSSISIYSLYNLVAAIDTYFSTLQYIYNYIR